MTLPTTWKPLLAQMAVCTAVFLALETAALFLLPEDSRVASMLAAFGGLFLTAPLWVAHIRQERLRARSLRRDPLR